MYTKMLAASTLVQIASRFHFLHTKTESYLRLQKPYRYYGMVYFSSIAKRALLEPILRNKINPRKISRTMCLKSFEEGSEPTVKQLKDKLYNMMGVSQDPNGIFLANQKRAHLMQYITDDQTALPARTMKDSFTTAIIPLSTDLELREKYITFLGSVRIGRLLEDIDFFAVCVVVNHMKLPNLPPNEKLPYTVVTALVDKISFTDYRTKPSEDIRLLGQVTWAGRTSLEVSVWLEQKVHGTYQHITRAHFVMVARSVDNLRSIVVNPLEAGNEEEKMLLEQATRRQQEHRERKSASLRRMAPTPAEINIIHNLFTKTLPDYAAYTQRVLPPGSVWMESAMLNNLIFSHPEYRNMNNTVFGGFLMRQATEISWHISYLFSRYQPKLKHISDIVFHRPIPVHSMIKLYAYVTYTELNYIHVFVEAEVHDSVSAISALTNQFHFVYEIPELCSAVIPSTYSEAMMYLEGRRHFIAAIHDWNEPPDIPTSVNKAKL